MLTTVIRNFIRSGGIGKILYPQMMLFEVMGTCTTSVYELHPLNQHNQGKPAIECSKTAVVEIASSRRIHNVFFF